MAELEIAPLAHRLEEDQLTLLHDLLQKHGIARLPRTAGTPTTLGDRIDEDTLREFLDLLDSHDAACDVYLPVSLRAPLRVGSLRVGTTERLLDALEELRGDLDIEDEEEVLDEDAPDDEPEARLRDLWRLFQQGAEAAQLKRLPLLVHA
jgi:hypothetical protein